MSDQIETPPAQPKVRLHRLKSELSEEEYQHVLAYRQAYQASHQEQKRLCAKAYFEKKGISKNEYNRELYQRNGSRDFVECSCGHSVRKISLPPHLKTKKHEKGLERMLEQEQIQSQA